MTIKTYYSVRYDLISSDQVISSDHNCFRCGCCTHLLTYPKLSLKQHLTHKLCDSINVYIDNIDECPAELLLGLGLQQGQGFTVREPLYSCVVVVMACSTELYTFPAENPETMFPSSSQIPAVINTNREI